MKLDKEQAQRADLTRRIHSAAGMAIWHVMEKLTAINEILSLDEIRDVLATLNGVVDKLQAVEDENIEALKDVEEL